VGYQVGPTGVKPELQLGTTISYEDIERGLRELNPQVTFDAAVRRPSDYTYVLQGGDNMTEIRTGVYYNGRYICAVDRGAVPEFKMWNEVDGLEPVPLSEIDRHGDDTRVSFIKVKPGMSGYEAAKASAERHEDNFKLLDDGTVMVYECFREGKVLGKVIRVGWRHTFESLIRAAIPGVTRAAIAEKFKIDMNKFPIGTPAEVDRLLYEE
jgi:hypothetical protein